MKPTVTISLAVGLLAIGAGIAIAGLPDKPPGDALIITATPNGTTTTTLSVVVDTVSPLPTTTTTSTTTTEPPRTTDPIDSNTTTTTTTTSPADRPLAPREELRIVTANGAGADGIAETTATGLEALGYVDVEATTAPAVADRSVVYHIANLTAEASRLAADLGWPVDTLAPIEAAPAITVSEQADIIVLIGLDQTGPSD